MTNYKDAETQTIWQGLTQHEHVRLIVSPAQDTTTPSDELVAEKSQLDQLNSSPESAETSAIQTAQAEPPMTDQAQLQQTAPFHMASAEDDDISPSSVAAARSLPSFALNDDDPASPPPTHAVLSPPPEANRRYAGHTPLIPPIQDEQEPDDYFGRAALEQATGNEDNFRTPDADEGLTGALTLPANPVDGTADHIELEELDKILSKIARQQAILRGDDEDELNPMPTRKQQQKPKRRADSEPIAPSTVGPTTQSTHAGPSSQTPLPDSVGQPLTQTTSADKPKPKPKPKTYVENGIVFKANAMNFDMPWGKVPRNHRGSM